MHVQQQLTYTRIKCKDKQQQKKREKTQTLHNKLTNPESTSQTQTATNNGLIIDKVRENIKVFSLLKLGPVIIGHDRHWVYHLDRTPPDLYGFTSMKSYLGCNI